MKSIILRILFALFVTAVALIFGGFLLFILLEAVTSGPNPQNNPKVILDSFFAVAAILGLLSLGAVVLSWVKVFVRGKFLDKPYLFLIYANLALPVVALAIYILISLHIL